MNCRPQTMFLLGSVLYVLTVAAVPIGHGEPVDGKAEEAASERSDLLMHEGDHPQLFDMYTREQEVRAEFDPAEEDKEKLFAHLREMAVVDEENRPKLIEICRNGDLRTAYDFFRAAIMFAHQTKGDQVSAMQVAMEYAITSMRLGCPEAPYTVARTYDRMLDCLGRGQRYGTQYGMDSELLPIDEGVVPMCDFVRAQLDVPPRP